MITHAYARIEDGRIFAEADVVFQWVMTEERKAVLLSECASALNAAQIKIAMQPEAEIQRLFVELSERRRINETLQKPQ